MAELWRGIHQEKEDAGNSFRMEYQKGICHLLGVLREESDEKRKQYWEELKERPDDFRQRVFSALGWPLTEPRQKVRNVRINLVAEDEEAFIYRVQLEIWENVWFYGILFIQRDGGPRPMVLCQHGGGGTPEICSSFFNSANYNDMTRRFLKRGVNVFCPQLFLWDQARFGSCSVSRQELDKDLKQVGSSITALEIDALMKAIDWMYEEKFIVSKAVGMAGLSYGGFYTLYMAALDKRIQAALSSCFFNDRYRYNWSDWVWQNSGNTFLDGEMAALAAPRKLWIQVGERDELFDHEGATREYERAKPFYSSAPENLRFELFHGTHELSPSDDGINFVTEALWNEVRSEEYDG